MSERPIGVFDSGLGGLTVLRAIQEQLPAESTVYFGDTARVPYGTKSPAAIQRYADEAGEFLVRQGVKAVVVACNTASAVALPRLKQNLDVPVVGVIDGAARRAVEMTRQRQVGVIGTRATIQSRAYEEAILKLDPTVEIHAKACPLFVPLAEEGWVTGPIPRMVAETYLAGMGGVDCLVLACTHYPLLEGVIREVLADRTTVIDSATETARDLVGVLREARLERADPKGPAHRLHYVSDDPAAFAHLGERFFGRPITDVVTVRFQENG